MAKILMSLLLALVSAAALADAGLVGEWRSDGDAVNLPGRLALKADGSFVMTPSGLAAARGTYTAKNPDITLRLASSPHLPASGVYVLSDDGKTLVLQFQTGQQHFTRITAKE